MTKVQGDADEAVATRSWGLDIGSVRKTLSRTRAW